MPQMTTAPEPAPARRHRLRTALLVAGGVLLVYLVLGLVFGPGWARSSIERAFAENTRGHLSLGRIAVNPLLLSATLHDVSLTGAGEDSLFSVSSLTVDLSVRSLFQRAAVFDHILIDSPALWLVVGRDSTLHWQHVLRPTSETAHAKAQLPRLVVRHFRLRDGRVVFEDSTKRTPYLTGIRPLALELHDFSTLPTDRGTHVVDATFPSGGTLHWEGGLIAQPFGADGHVRIDGLPLATLWEYIKDDVSFGALGGTLSFATDYRVRTAGDSAGIVLSAGRLRLQNAALGSWGGDSALTTVPDLIVGGVRVDLARSQARIEQVKWHGGRLRASLSRDTVLNLSHLFEPRGAAARAKAKVKAPPPAGPPWRVQLDRFVIDGVSVAFEDSTQRPPVGLDMDQVGLEVKGVDNGRDLAGSLAASLRLEGSGRVEASGKVAILPVRTDLALRGSAIPLRPLQAYVDTFIKLDIVRGTGDVDGRMGINERPGGVFAFRYAGSARMNDVVATDPAAGEDFLRFQSVRMSRVLMELGPDRMRLGDVDVASPKATIALGTDASLNLFRIFPSLKPPPPGVVVPVTPFTIDRIQVRDGTLAFVDQTIQPAFQSSFSAVNGEITNLSSDPAAEAHIQLEGRSGGAGPLKIAARLRPADKEPFAHFTFDFGGFDCLELSTYTGKYLNHAVDRGQMSMSLGYDIESRKLKGTNHVKLDQFYLASPKTESPVATHLPVGLALALLRDKNGVIDIDVPVQGDLDDPKFRIGGVIVQALLNLLTKAALSPFALLGKVFGGSTPEDMSAIAFAAGSDSLGASSMERLGQVAKLIGERPALRLNVSGAADSVSDRAALAVAALEHRLVSERRAEYFAARVAEPDRAAAAPWPAGERERVLAKLYRKDFGADTLAARLPASERPARDLKRIGDACARGLAPQVTPLKGASLVTSDTWLRVERRVLAGTRIDRDALARLADARAAGIRAALVTRLAVPEDHVFLRPASWKAAGADGRIVSTLELGAD